MKKTKGKHKSNRPDGNIGQAAGYFKRRGFFLLVDMARTGVPFWNLYSMKTGRNLLHCFPDSKTYQLTNQVGKHEYRSWSDLATAAAVVEPTLAAESP